MTFSQSLALVTGLLYLEKRVTYRRLRKELGLDEETFNDVCYELIVARRLAIDDKGEVLVWVGESRSDTPLPTPEPLATPALDSSPRDNKISASLSEPSGRDAEAERRQLTVMFCDLVGSTELSTCLDPEDLREIITGFQDQCRTAVQRYDGFIARYMGDGLLVYFGYPQAHEQDAERAVRAGLDIVSATANLNRDIGTKYAVEITVRVGIATGPVVVGDIIGEGASEESAVVGETPNLAARLQGVAKPNQVAIGTVSHELIGDLFAYEDLGTHQLKGIAEPAQVWRVTGEAEPESSYTGRANTTRLPLVGRREELGLLLRAWEGSKEGHGQVVLISGEAGIGKSRLLEALRDELADTDYAQITIRASPYHVSSTLYPVIEHVKRVVGWQDEDQPEERLEKLEQTLTHQQSLPLPEVLPIYAALLSLPLPTHRRPLNLTPQQQRQETQDALVAWLMEEAERKPLLTVWEDLHWADATTVELLGYLIEQVPTVPMMIVGTFRPEFVLPWSSRSHMTPVTLNRLERAEMQAITTNLAGGKRLPDEVMAHIVAKSDGVPLYVEELGKAILASGVLEEQAQQFALRGLLSDMHIPETLQDSLMARLDRFPLAREVAQLGAVVGREFAYQMLSALRQIEDTTLRETLDQLVETELLYQRGRPPRSRYTFRHALIRDAAYQSLLKRTRQRRHQQVAALIESQFPEVAENQPELLAYHYEEATLGERAIEYWQKAGQIATDRAANVEAIEHFGKAIGLLETLDNTPNRARQRLSLLTSLASTLSVTRGYAHPEVGEVFQRARDLCDRVGDINQSLTILRGLWIFNFVRGELGAARALGEECSRLTERHNNTAVRLEGHHTLGDVLFCLGEFNESQNHLGKAIELYDIEKHRENFLYGAIVGVLPMCFSAHNLWHQGYPDQALQRIEEALRLADELSHPFSRALALDYAAMLHQFRREHEEAAILAAQAIEVCAEKRYEYYLAWGIIIHGWALVEQGGDESHIQRMHQGLDDLKATGAALRLPYYLVTLAEATGKLGRVDEALRILNEAQAAAQNNGERWREAECNRLRGQLLLARSDNGCVEAEKSFAKALDVARHQQARSLELRATLSLARVRQAQQRGDDARKMLYEIYSQFTEGFDTADLQDAKTLLEQLS